jgi:4-alpha-glucanotransferase
MTDTTLQRLAAHVGVDAAWRDYRGEAHAVSDETLCAILTALGWPAEQAADQAASLARAEHEHRQRPPLLTVTAGQPFRLQTAAKRATLQLEGGDSLDLDLVDQGGEAIAQAPFIPGYHRLDLGDGEVVLAVAPSRALTIADLAGGRKAWGAAAQIYSLNGGDAFGDFGDVARVAHRLGGLGADALAISPAHALFSADLGRYAPYGPSTRLFLNALYAPEQLASAV